MKKINLHNYEAFLLDYSEGTLSTSEIRELQAFLNLHPELEIDLNDLSFPSLDENFIAADFKENLKRTKNPVSETDLINYLEGNLNKDQVSALESELAKDPLLRRELELYKKTLLPVENALVFSGKSDLKKTEDDLILNDLSIAYLEDQLVPEAREKFEFDLSNNTQLRSEFELFEKTVLKADLTQVFENKAGLKKQNKVFILFERRAMVSMAAALMLIMGLVLVFNYYLKQDVAAEEYGSNTKQKKLSSDKIVADKNKVEQNAKESSSLKTGSEPTAHKTLSENNLVASKVESNKSSTPEKSAKVTESLAVVEKITVPVEGSTTTVVPDKELSTENKAAIASAIQSELTRLTEIAEVVDDEEEDPSQQEKPKYTLWKRAVKLAQGANNIGLKAVNGEKNESNGYVLTINSFSIEKK